MIVCNLWILALKKNLEDNHFEYLTLEIGSKYLELWKQTDVCPYEYIDSFKIFSEKQLPDKKCFYRSLKDGKNDGNGEK